MTPPSEGNELLDHAERLQTRAGPRTLQFEADIRIQGFRIRSRNADREPHPNSPQDYKHQTLEYPLEVKTNPTEANMRSFRRNILLSALVASILTTTITPAAWSSPSPTPAPDDDTPTAEQEALAYEE